jgi:sulfite reductase beta subunit-like hemoprotein
MSATLNKAELAKQAKDGFDVLADLYRYSEQGDYDAIEKDDLEIRFKWFGVYRQKPNTGHFMMRIKVPGGQLTPHLFRVIAGLGEKYARGFGDITTRQTIQYHWLKIADLKPIFETLSSVGLTTQFACGDVPRNVVGCPLAGVSKDEIIDSADHLKAVADMFVASGKEFSNLPRKFKPSVGGCHVHCQQPQINDYGLFGVRRANGEVGYGLLVGGGLSDTPHFGQPMRVFIKPEQVVDVSRAVASLFRDHGYREKRGRARLKFLVADKGWEWTRDTIEGYLGYKLERDDSILHPAACNGDHMGIGEQKDGNYYVGVPIPRGRLSTDKMFILANLADKYGVGEKRVRLTNKQNVLLLDIPKENVEALTQELEAADMPPVAHQLRDTLISCTGTEFCNLAVVETKHRAGRVLKYLEENVKVDFPLGISFTGCPNACAQYQIFDIGLTGTMLIDRNRKDEAGKPLKIEGYNVLLGAGLGANPKFGEVIAKKVPGDLIHLAIKNLVESYRAQRVDEDESFQSWVARSEPEYLQNLIESAVSDPNAVPLTA